jgi:hypothetical protein
MRSKLWARGPGKQSRTWSIALRIGWDPDPFIWPPATAAISSFVNSQILPVLLISVIVAPSTFPIIKARRMPTLFTLLDCIGVRFLVKGIFCRPSVFPPPVVLRSPAAQNATVAHLARHQPELTLCANNAHSKSSALANRKAPGLCPGLCAYDRDRPKLRDFLRGMH